MSQHQLPTAPSRTSPCRARCSWPSAAGRPPPDDAAGSCWREERCHHDIAQAVDSQSIARGLRHQSLVTRACRLEIEGERQAVGPEPVQGQVAPQLEVRLRQRRTRPWRRAAARSTSWLPGPTEVPPGGIAQALVPSASIITPPCHYIASFW
ncbi:MAG: hypothetical protein MZV65_53130 [Chromatiales bacterium]|nr:hypothetical protein [Chromatiales bacterium]